MVAPRAWPNSGGAVDEATLAALQAPPVQRRGPRRGVRPSRAQGRSCAAPLSPHSVAGRREERPHARAGTWGLRGGPYAVGRRRMLCCSRSSPQHAPEPPSGALLVRPGRAVDILNVFTSRAVLRSLERGPPSTLGVFRGEPRGLPRLNDPPHAGGAAPRQRPGSPRAMQPPGMGRRLSVRGSLGS